MEKLANKLTDPKQENCVEKIGDIRKYFDQAQYDLAELNCGREFDQDKKGDQKLMLGKKSDQFDVLEGI